MVESTSREEKLFNLLKARERTEQEDLTSFQYRRKHVRSRVLILVSYSHLQLIRAKLSVECEHARLETRAVTAKGLFRVSLQSAAYFPYCAPTYSQITSTVPWSGHQEKCLRLQLTTCRGSPASALLTSKLARLPIAVFQVGLGRFARRCFATDDNRVNRQRAVFDGAKDQPRNRHTRHG